MLDTSPISFPVFEARRWAVLVELSVMEQRYQAVLAVVQDGWKVVEVARRPTRPRRGSWSRGSGPDGYVPFKIQVPRRPETKEL
jgi:hypothetical protein